MLSPPVHTLPTAVSCRYLYHQKNQDMYTDVNIARIVPLNLNNFEANINIFGTFLHRVFAGFGGIGCLYTLAKWYIHL